MKNIHVVPTDKPSNGYILGKCIKELSDVKIGQFVKTYYLMFDKEYFHPYNIYITSDEEISGFENNIWVYNNGRVWLWQNTMALISDNKPKKIILTTDQSLDGVQAIDDEFLEWFVKNPSCKFIQSKRLEDGQYFDHFEDNSVIEGIYENYKIIIPQEEFKQETIEEAIIGLAQLLKDDPKFFIQEPKQETLEEVAERYIVEHNYLQGFINQFEEEGEHQELSNDDWTVLRFLEWMKLNNFKIIKNERK
jgi:hypothetical protein